MAKPTTTIEVIFKRSWVQVIRNLFVPKAKRYPRVATFKGFTDYNVSEHQLYVRWGGARYIYPMHKIERIKFS